jgi:hypothetical protein
MPTIFKGGTTLLSCLFCYIVICHNVTKEENGRILPVWLVVNAKASAASGR